jgi:hypothetical protein
MATVPLIDSRGYQGGLAVTFLYSEDSTIPLLGSRGYPEGCTVPLLHSRAYQDGCNVPLLHSRGCSGGLYYNTSIIQGLYYNTSTLHGQPRGAVLACFYTQGGHPGGCTITLLHSRSCPNSYTLTPLYSRGCTVILLHSGAAQGAEL